jgi:hypothetical protein
MPTYIIRKDDDTPLEEAHTWEVFCSHKELQEMCAEYGVRQVLSAPKIVSMVGHNITKTPDSWRDHLKGIKSGSGRGNTIKT